MKRPLFCLTLVGLALGLAILPGCKKGGDSSAAGNPVIIWHWMTDREDAFNELAKKYKQETGKDVQFHLFAPSDVYSQKIEVGAQTNSLPDVFGVLGDSA